MKNPKGSSWFGQIGDIRLIYFLSLSRDDGGKAPM